MALHLHCKRSKLFMRYGVGNKTEKASCPVGQITVVPDWVKSTPGYAAGVKDGSIVDLTPPTAAVVSVKKANPPADVKADVKDEGANDEKGEESALNEDDSEGSSSEQLKKPSKRRGGAPQGLQSR